MIDSEGYKYLNALFGEVVQLVAQGMYPGPGHSLQQYVKTSVTFSTNNVVAIMLNVLK